MRIKQDMKELRQKFDWLAYEIQCEVINRMRENNICAFTLYHADKIYTAMESIDSVITLGAVVLYQYPDGANAIKVIDADEMDDVPFLSDENSTLAYNDFKSIDWDDFHATLYDLNECSLFKADTIYQISEALESLMARLNK